MDKGDPSCVAIHLYYSHATGIPKGAHTHTYLLVLLTLAHLDKRLSKRTERPPYLHTMPSCFRPPRLALTLVGMLVLCCVCQVTSAFSTPFTRFHRKLGEVDIDEELLDFDEESLVTEMRRLVGDLRTTSNLNSSSDGHGRNLFAGVAGLAFCVGNSIGGYINNKTNPYEKR